MIWAGKWRNLKYKDINLSRAPEFDAHFGFGSKKNDSKLPVCASALHTIFIFYF